MHPTVEGVTLWIPNTEDDKEMVREQMNRLLETSHFKNSRRYPPLLRFIVEETLEGRGEFLKERLLGVRVFERPADYDTASDPIVRVTIAEIRKRIAQYYHEEAHDSEIRIELLPGRYEPEFRPSRDHHRAAERLPPTSPQQAPAADSNRPMLQPPAVEAAEAREPAVPPGRHLSRNVRYGLISLAVAAVVLISAAAWRWIHPSAIEQFWAPILDANKTITFCLPNRAGNQPGMAAISPASSDGAPSEDPRSPTFLDHEAHGENVVFSDALAVARISNLMAARHRESRFRLNVGTTLDDLRQGPVILVGGMDNQWTLRAIASLPFRFAGSDAGSYWIADKNNPNNRDWALDATKKYAVVNRDYAIIARIHDEATGELAVIVAGIGMSGTAAAGEFLVDPQQLEELRRRVGPGFADHDFEAVLSTDVVNGVAGSPHILTVATW